jgi:hypothetical protein
LPNGTTPVAALGYTLEPSKKKIVGPKKALTNPRKTKK